MIVKKEKKKYYVLIKDFDTFMYDLHYIMKENICVVIVCKLSEQQKYWNVILNIASKLMVRKVLRCLRRVNILNLKTMKKKKIIIKWPFMIYTSFKSILVF